MGQCEARTTKGNQCRKSAIPGSIYCKIHESNSEIWAGQLLQIVVLELERHKLTLSAQTIHHAKTVIAGYTASSKQLLDGDHKQFTKLVETLKDVSPILHSYVNANFLVSDKTKKNSEETQSPIQNEYEQPNETALIKHEGEAGNSFEEAAKNWAKTVENASYVAGVMSSGDNKNPDPEVVSKVIKESVLNYMESGEEDDLRTAIGYFHDSAHRQLANVFLNKIIVKGDRVQTKRKGRGLQSLITLLIVIAITVALFTEIGR
jgi:hypothetical protein